MKSVELEVLNPSGLHARPAATFAAAAARFTARVTIENLDRAGPAVDAKSVLSVLTKGIDHGHRIRLTADGTDEDEAIAALAALVEAGAGEGTAEGSAERTSAP